jgi:hypothetical protein
MEKEDDSMNKFLGLISSLKEDQVSHTKKRILNLNNTIKNFSKDSNTKSKEIVLTAKDLINQYKKALIILEKTDKLQKENIKVVESIRKLEQDLNLKIQTKALEK